MTRHQEESSTSQLGWHAKNTHILCGQTQKMLFKNGKKYIYIQEERLSQNPRQKKTKKQRKAIREI